MISAGGLAIHEAPGASTNRYPDVSPVGTYLRFVAFQNVRDEASMWGMFANGTWSCIEQDLTFAYFGYVRLVTEGCPTGTFYDQDNGRCVYDCARLRFTRADGAFCPEGC